MADIWLLANSIIRSARGMIVNDLKPLGLKSADGNVLFHLLSAGTENFRQEDIVRDLEISKPAVSKALETLEKKGLIKRTKDPLDKRASIVHLTKKAFESAPMVTRIYNRVFTQAIAGISQDRAQSFLETFAKVSKNLSAQKEG